MEKIAVLEKSIVGVKFTPAQKSIVNQLLNGWEIKVINTHHMSGGQWMWQTPNHDSLQYAGSVYKAFFNVFYQIKKQKGIIVQPNQFVNY